MTFFNSTSKILPYIYKDLHGVVMPNSCRVLFRSDVYSKIQKTESHIDLLSNALSHRKTHGGKSFRALQISVRDQIVSSSKRLALLRSGNEIINRLEEEVPCGNPIFADKNSIFSTLQSSACIFHVRAKARGEWLSHRCDMGSGKELERWRETLKKTDYYFHKIKEEEGKYIAFPVGFWHKDGRLAFPTRKERECAEGNCGAKKSEILNNGCIKFLTTEVPYTFLPRGISLPDYNFFPGKSAEFVLEKNYQPNDSIYFKSSTFDSFFSEVCVAFKNKSISVYTNDFNNKFSSYLLRQGLCENFLGWCVYKAIRTPDLQKLCKILLNNNTFPTEWVLFFETIQKDGTWIINSNKDINKLYKN